MKGLMIAFFGVITFAFTFTLCAAIPKQEDLKIINWNVLYGFNHKKSIQKGAKWLKNQNPDVLGLQELTNNNADSLKVLAKQWGHDYSVILKQDGFPVGLTSKRPIEVIERRVKGFHHGYLHCKTYGIHFFVVHFWPKKDHEAMVIIDKIKLLLTENESVIVMGDFNTHSQKDKAYLSARSSVEPLFDVVDNFEKFGFVDLVYKHDPKVDYSFPSPIIIPKWAKTLEEVESKKQRIDFIFADKVLAKYSVAGTIIRSDVLDKISDHYPVVVEFRILMKNEGSKFKK